MVPFVCCNSILAWVQHWLFGRATLLSCLPRDFVDFENGKRTITSVFGLAPQSEPQTRKWRYQTPKYNKRQYAKQRRHTRTLNCGQSIPWQNLGGFHAPTAARAFGATETADVIANSKAMTTKAKALIIFFSIKRSCEYSIEATPLTLIFSIFANNG